MYWIFICENLIFKIYSNYIKKNKKFYLKP